MDPTNSQARCNLVTLLGHKGRFDEAIRVAQEARRVALAAKNQAVAGAAGSKLELYRAGQPSREK